MIVTRLAKKIIAEAIRLSMKGLPRGPHITRYYMYQRLAELRQAPGSSAKVLAVSDSKMLCELLGLENCQITEANYPEYNILSLPFSDHSFDYVVSDQVLEHVEGDPQVAIDETYRVLKPGGLAIHTTCFINPIHGAPNDFWRFTPNALELLCRQFSNIIQCEGWGNPYVWIVDWVGLRYDSVPHKKWHPLHKIALLNHADWPIDTWIVVQK